MVARLLVSYAISAPDDPPEVVAQAMATILLQGAIAFAANAAADDLPASEHVHR